MGIFIQVKISSSLTQEQWEPVYQKSLRMAKAFGFYDCSQETIHGQKVCCLIPTDEYCPDEGDIRRNTGWYASGTLADYRGAETQFTPKYLGSDEQQTIETDILTEALADYTSNGMGAKFHRIWNNKTQGEPYHMDLLAIACLIENELGIQAMVSGDISYGQCVEAAETASAMLDEDVPLPIRCRAFELAERISKMTEISNSEKIQYFFDLFIGEKNSSTGDALCTAFSSDALYEYWKSEFNSAEFETYSFANSVKRYLELGFDLDNLCVLANFDKSDAKHCQSFIKQLADGSLFSEVKDCYDPFDLSKRSKPYGVGDLLASFAFRTARNKAIDRYIPVEEAAEILEKHFGGVLNVKDFINECNENKTADNTTNELNSKLNEIAENHHEMREQYDLCDYSDLVNFKIGCKILPKLDEAIIKSFAFYCSMTDKDEFGAFKDKSADKLFAYLAEQERRYILTAEHWERIYSELERDTSTFARYYPMTRVEANNDLRYLLRAFVTDDAFWEYCNGKKL